jgi:predicted small integral membrane protein
LSWRLSKTLLVLAAALHWTIVVFNNLVDHPTNLHYVQHVLSMDTVVEANRSSWRAIHNPAVQHAFYWLIILTEATAMTLLWWGGARLLRHLRSDDFGAAKDRAVQGLTLVLLLFFSGFTSVGGEWFMMWQSTQWDGLNPAARLFAIHGLILVWLGQDEPARASG